MNSNDGGNGWLKNPAESGSRNECLVSAENQFSSDLYFILVIFFVLDASKILCQILIFIEENTYLEVTSVEC